MATAYVVACRLNFTAHLHIPYYIMNGHRVLAFDRLPIVGCQNLMFISSFWPITTKISRLKALLRLLEICFVPIQLVHRQITFLYQEKCIDATLMKKTISRAF